MTTEQMSCFLALWETMNFSRAAEISNLSPSAFSRIIQRTEDELGVRLCYRSNREVQLSPQGESFLEYCRQSLGEWKAFQQRLAEEKQELGGELRVFATVTACYSILPPILRPFRALHQGVDIHIRTGDAADALEMVRQNRVDCAISPVPASGSADLLIRKLTTSALVFVAPSPRHREQGMAVRGLLNQLEDFPASADWNQLPLILPEKGLSRQIIDQWFRDRQLRPRIHAQVAGNEGILAMVNLGLGIGLVPELVVANSPMTEGLRILPKVEGISDFPVGIAARNSARHNPVVMEFMRLAELEKS